MSGKTLDALSHEELAMAYISYSKQVAELTAQRKEVDRQLADLGNALGEVDTALSMLVIGPAAPEAVAIPLGINSRDKTQVIVVRVHQTFGDAARIIVLGEPS